MVTKVVRAAFQAILDHGSVSRAAKWLNQNGLNYQAPLRCGGFRPRNRHFTFDALYRLLSNKAYAGIRVIRSKDGIQETQAVWPAIVDPETFGRAQQVLEAGRRQKTGRESRYPYLLSTRIFCGQCGAPLIGNSAHGKTTKVPYYGHGSQLKREQTIEKKSERCTPFRVPGRKIEDRVWKEVLSLIESPSHREPLFRSIQRLGENRASRVEARRREADLLATTEKLSNLARRIADLPSGVPADALYDEMKRLGEKKGWLEGELSLAREREEAQSVVTEAQYTRLLERLKSQLIDPSHETKRRIIHALIHRVVVTATGFDLHFYVGADKIKTGEALTSPVPPLKLLGKNFSVQSSFKA